jgi:hypothetical protein
MVRRHLQWSAAAAKEPHFCSTAAPGGGLAEDAGLDAGAGAAAGSTLRFRRHVVDAVSGAPGVKLLDFSSVSAGEELRRKLAACRSEADDRRAVADLGALLERMLSPDPTTRITVKEALQHPFITGVHAAQQAHGGGGAHGSAHGGALAR